MTEAELLENMKNRLVNLKWWESLSHIFMFFFPLLFAILHISRYYGVKIPAHLPLIALSEFFLSILAAGFLGAARKRESKKYNKFIRAMSPRL